MPKYRLIALDLDGTLLNSGMKVSDANQEALRKSRRSRRESRPRHVALVRARQAHRRPAGPRHADHLLERGRGALPGRPRDLPPAAGRRGRARDRDLGRRPRLGDVHHRRHVHLHEPSPRHHPRKAPRRPESRRAPVGPPGRRRPDLRADLAGGVRPRSRRAFRAEVRRPRALLLQRAGRPAALRRDHAPGLREGEGAGHRLRGAGRAGRKR